MPTRLGDMAVGSIVKINMTGQGLVSHTIVHQGKPSNDYGDTSNGTWLYLADPDISLFTNGYVEYDSTYDYQTKIHSKLVNYWTPRYSAVADYMQTVSIPCVNSAGSTIKIQTKIFNLSSKELNCPKINGEYNIPNEGTPLSYFSDSGTSQYRRQFTLTHSDGSAKSYGTRSSSNSSTVTYCSIETSGEPWISSGAVYTRPCIVLNQNLIIDDSGNIIGLPPDLPSTITAPSSVTKTEQFTVAWSSVQDATEYVLERKVNNGEYSQLYTGLNTSYFDTALSDWSSVQYRVKAGKDGNYSDYKESTVIAVKDIDFTVSGIRTPKNVLVGDSINITWDPTPFANTYKVERKINDLSWEVVHVGPTTTYSDIAGPWKTVQYRIVAGLNDQYGTTFTETFVVTINESSLGGMVRKERVHRKNSDGVYDVIHYETECSVVIMSDGTKVEDKLNEIQNGQLVPKIIASYNK